MDKKTAQLIINDKNTNEKLKFFPFRKQDRTKGYYCLIPHNDPYENESDIQIMIYWNGYQKFCQHCKPYTEGGQQKCEECLNGNRLKRIDSSKIERLHPETDDLVRLPEIKAHRKDQWWYKTYDRNGFIIPVFCSKGVIYCKHFKREGKCMRCENGFQVHKPQRLPKKRRRQVEITDASERLYYYDTERLLKHWNDEIRVLTPEDNPNGGTRMFIYNPRKQHWISQLFYIHAGLKFVSAKITMMYLVRDKHMWSIQHHDEDLYNNRQVNLYVNRTNDLKTKMRKITKEARERHMVMTFKKRIQVRRRIDKRWENVNSIKDAKKKLQVGQKNVYDVLKNGGNELLRYHPEDEAKFDLWWKHSKIYSFRYLIRKLQYGLYQKVNAKKSS